MFVDEYLVILELEFAHYELTTGLTGNDQHELGRRYVHAHHVMSFISLTSHRCYRSTMERNVVYCMHSTRELTPSIVSPGNHGSKR